MEPLSAFGLAVNILQVIDFGAKLMRDAHDLHHSSTGQKQEHVELQNIAKDLSRLTEKLSNEQGADAANLGLQEISTATKDVADDLVEAID